MHSENFSTSPEGFCEGCDGANCGRCVNNLLEATVGLEDLAHIQRGPITKTSRSLNVISSHSSVPSENVPTKIPDFQMIGAAEHVADAVENFPEHTKKISEQNEQEKNSVNNSEPQTTFELIDIPAAVRGSNETPELSESDYTIVELERLTPIQQKQIEQRFAQSQAATAERYNEREGTQEGLEAVFSMKLIEKDGSLDLLFTNGSMEGTTMLGTVDNAAAAEGNGVDRATMASYIAELKANYEVYIPILVDGVEVGMMRLWISGDEVFGQPLDIKRNSEQKFSEEEQSGIPINSAENDSNQKTIESTEDQAINPTAKSSSAPRRESQFAFANTESFETNGISIEVAAAVQTQDTHVTETKTVTPVSKPISFSTFNAIRQYFQIPQSQPAEQTLSSPTAFTEAFDFSKELITPPANINIETAYQNTAPDAQTRASENSAIEESEVEHSADKSFIKSEKSPFLKSTISSEGSTLKVSKSKEPVDNSQPITLSATSGKPKQAEKLSGTNMTTPEKTATANIDLPIDQPDAPQPVLKVNSITGETISAHNAPAPTPQPERFETHFGNNFDNSDTLKEQPTEQTKDRIETIQSPIEIKIDAPSAILEAENQQNSEISTTTELSPNLLEELETEVTTGASERQAEIATPRERLAEQKEVINAALAEAHQTIQLIRELRGTERLAERLGSNPPKDSGSIQISDEENIIRSITPNASARVPANLPVQQAA
ncbi:MAG: hypothetical protein JWO40_3 [Candidatus Doudnabacteria bacterium]|nr:hypothetical protein [Candidatus Doudnabacteria bacterium]